MTRHRTELRGGLIALFGAAVAVASGTQGEVEPKVSVSVAKTPIKAGATLVATIKIVFAPGLHAYPNPPGDPSNIPVTVSLSPSSIKSVRSLKVKYPKGVPITMTSDPKPVLAYSGTVLIPVTLQLGRQSGTITLNVNYQQCTESNCFPPKDVSVKFAVRIPKGKGPA